MTEEIIIDKEDKEKKHRNNEIDCLHFCCRKGESGKVLLWCSFYDDHCDNYTGCYYRKYLRLEQENKANLKQIELDVEHICNLNEQIKKLEQENKELKENYCEKCKHLDLYMKYKSALEEIKNDLKEICKEECDYTKPKFCGDCDCRYGQILNKINKVLNHSEG